MFDEGVAANAVWHSSMDGAVVWRADVTGRHATGGQVSIRRKDGYVIMTWPTSQLEAEATGRIE